MNGKKARQNRRDRPEQPPVTDGSQVPWGAAVDEVSERDRVYFETHPSVTHYVRPRVAGELGPAEQSPLAHTVTEVWVEQIRPGVRTRFPLIAGESGLPSWGQAHIDRLRQAAHAADHHQEQDRNTKIAARQRGRRPHKKSRR